MAHQILRREFLVAGGAAALGVTFATSAKSGTMVTLASLTTRHYNGFTPAGSEVPTLLDHILLGCSDLDRGIAFVEERTGVRAAFGGVHPGRGTRNALLSLGERRYLEIIAPDPEQSEVPDAYGLLRLDEPRLVTWAAHPGDIQALAARLAKAGIAAERPTPGSRKRLDGRLLQWKTLNLQETEGGLLPFFIEWSAGSTHPSEDSPKGCQLAQFFAGAPNPEAVRAMVEHLGIDLVVRKSKKPELNAVIVGKKGEFQIGCCWVNVTS